MFTVLTGSAKAKPAPAARLSRAASLAALGVVCALAVQSAGAVPVFDPALRDPALRDPALRDPALGGDLSACPDAGLVVLCAATVLPSAPTDADSVLETITGRVNTGGYVFPGPSNPAVAVDLAHHAISVNLRLASPPPGLMTTQVMLGFTASVDLGVLPAGTYATTECLILNTVSVSCLNGTIVVSPSSVAGGASPVPAPGGGPLLAAGVAALLGRGGRRGRRTSGGT